MTVQFRPSEVNALLLSLIHETCRSDLHWDWHQVRKPFRTSDALVFLVSSGITNPRQAQRSGGQLQVGAYTAKSGHVNAPTLVARFSIQNCGHENKKNIRGLYCL